MKGDRAPMPDSDWTSKRDIHSHKHFAIRIKSRKLQYSHNQYNCGHMYIYK